MKISEEERKHIYLQKFIAKFGSKQLIDRHKLTVGTHPAVRKQLIVRGFDDHLDKLMNDPNSDVREQVARYGKTKHHDYLMKDPEPLVRHAVAIYGGPSHAKILQHDSHEFVADAAKQHLREIGQYEDE